MIEDEAERRQCSRSYVIRNDGWAQGQSTITVELYNHRYSLYGGEIYCTLQAYTVKNHSGDRLVVC